MINVTAHLLCCCTAVNQQDVDHDNEDDGQDDRSTCGGGRKTASAPIAAERGDAVAGHLVDARRQQAARPGRPSRSAQLSPFLGEGDSFRTRKSPVLSTETTQLFFQRERRHPPRRLRAGVRVPR